MPIQILLYRKHILLVYFIVVLESVAGVGQLKIPIVDAVFLKSLHQVPCALKRRSYPGS